MSTAPPAPHGGSWGAMARLDNQYTAPASMYTTPNPRALLHLHKSPRAHSPQWSNLQIPIGSLTPELWRVIQAFRSPRLASMRGPHHWLQQAYRLFGVVDSFDDGCVTAVVQSCKPSATKKYIILQTAGFRYPSSASFPVAYIYPAPQLELSNFRPVLDPVLDPNLHSTNNAAAEVRISQRRLERWHFW
jgi:hypothetical protein